MHLPDGRLGNVNRSHCPNDLNIFDFNNVKMFLGYYVADRPGAVERWLLAKKNVIKI